MPKLVREGNGTMVSVFDMYNAAIATGGRKEKYPKEHRCGMPINIKYLNICVQTRCYNKQTVVKSKFVSSIIESIP